MLKIESMKRYLGVCWVLLLILGCKHEQHKGIYNQGLIEYKITYLNAEKDNYDPSFLPKKMTLSFNQEYSINMINGFMGFFKLGNITYFKNNEVKTHLKVLDKNYAIDGGKNDVMCCFDRMQDMNLQEDTTTCIIGGLKSKKIHVSFDHKPDNFDIYYTDEINLTHPNATTPYSSIEGVLTQFRLKMGPYVMQFRANKFDSTDSPKNEMEIPKDAIMVDREEMETILNRLMEQNN